MASRAANVPLIKTLPVDSLVPYAKNARTHSPAQVSQIAASIREFGFVAPVIVDGDRGIIAGHGRVLAAKEIGLDSVPCVEAGWLTETQKKAYVLADNKLAENAGWDLDLLRSEFGELALGGFDVELAGFGPVEIADILADRTVGLTDPDEAPPLQEVAVSKPGDVWLLGRHRLACGDCTDAETVANALAGAKPHLMVTDPPYGVDYDPAWRLDAAKKGLIGFRPSALGVVANDKQSDWREAWALFPGDVVYAWYASLMHTEVASSLLAASFLPRSQIVWAKSSFAISRGNYHWQHETCLYCIKKGSTAKWAGDRSQSTLWVIAHSKNESGHSTQKPVECMRRPMENNSKSGDSVYEPFVGSGTTIIAAETLGRSCVALEVNPLYVDMSVRRWQNFTGQEATREQDGKTFAEAERDGSGGA